MPYKNYSTKRTSCQALKLSDEWQAISDSVASPLIKKVTYYKYANRKIIAALQAIGEPAKAGAVYGCGTFIRTGKRNGHEVITEANFCRQRLCQVCAWRRAAKFTAQMFPVMRNLEASGYKAIFVTLTIKNQPAAGVSYALDTLLKGWDRLIHNNRWYRTNVKGFVRSLEVTYNITTDTYHPHIHALLFMPQDYAQRGGNYKTQKEIQADWTAATKLDYNPIVDVRAVKKQKTKSNTTKAAVVETLKYCYKVDQRSISDKTIATLLYALAGRRLVSFGGVVAEERRALQMGELDDNLNDDLEPGGAYDVLYLFSPSGWKIIENE